METYIIAKGRSYRIGALKPLISLEVERGNGRVICNVLIQVAADGTTFQTYSIKKGLDIVRGEGLSFPETIREISKEDLLSLLKDEQISEEQVEKLELNGVIFGRIG
jgi:hypothetical protein